MVSEAQWVAAVTSTKISSSGPSVALNWFKKNIGSTQGAIRTVAASHRSTWRDR